MKVSTKGRYGLRIMIELALCHSKCLLTAREMAESQGISEKYIEQIVGSLTRGGLVRSQRGAAGGYMLAEVPVSITVAQILRATEGGLLDLEEIINGKNDVESPSKSIAAEIWQEVREAIEEVVDNITLADLVVRYNQKYNFSYMI